MPYWPWVYISRFSDVHWLRLWAIGCGRFDGQITPGAKAPVWWHVASFKVFVFWLVVEPTISHKYARQNGIIFPKFRGEHKKYLSCHHLVLIGFQEKFQQKKQKTSSWEFWPDIRMNRFIYLNNMSIVRSNCHGCSISISWGSAGTRLIENGLISGAPINWDQLHGKVPQVPMGLLACCMVQKSG